MSITIFGVVMGKKPYRLLDHKAIKVQLKAFTEIVPQCLVKPHWLWHITVQWDFTVLCVFQGNKWGVIFWWLRLVTIWIDHAMLMFFVTRLNQRTLETFPSLIISLYMSFFMPQSSVQFSTLPSRFFISKWPLFRAWTKSWVPILPNDVPSLDNVILTCEAHHMLCVASVLKTVAIQTKCAGSWAGDIV